MCRKCNNFYKKFPIFKKLNPQTKEKEELKQNV